jgi:hypothetical protein
MAGVYSTRFVYATVPGEWQAYVVPAGLRAVVRNLSIVAISGPCAFALGIGPAYVWDDSLTGPSMSRSIDLRQVAYSGEQIAITKSTAAGAAVVSGYLFREVLGIAVDAPVPVPGDPPAGYV